MPTSVVSVGLCLVAALLYIYSSTSKRNKGLPPNPRGGLPFLGNALQLPGKFMFRKLCQWQEQLGDIYSFSVGHQTMVVLGSARVASDILDRMASATSSRPSYTMYNLMTRNMNFIMTTDPERWRRHRRIVHENLNSRAVAAYFPLQEKCAAELVHSLAGSPSDLREVLSRYSGTMIWKALYGESSPNMDEQIKKISSYMELLADAVSPSSSAVNFLPFLLKLPLSVNPWKRFGDNFYADYQDFGLELLQTGSQPGLETEASFAKSCIKAKEQFPDVDDIDIAWITSNLFGAAVETTAHTLHFFILAMILYPDMAATAQKAVDAVVGERPPTFQDRHQLDYVDAIIRELLRWRTVTPFGLPHVVTEDFQYEGYAIPKGAILIANIWHINHNANVFSEPEQFLPERYLDSDGRLKTPAPDYHDDALAFGYGRRICPGRDFASNELFISIAYLLWSFDFCKAADEQGESITPSPNALEDENVAIYPSAFPYVLKPRRDLSAILEI